MNGNNVRPMYDTIVSKLSQAFHPAVLTVRDISASHTEHEEMRKSGYNETHFEIEITSDAFKNMSAVARHRAVYGQLQDQFQKGLHAVSIRARTLEEPK